MANQNGPAGTSGGTDWQRGSWDSFVQRLYRQHEFVIKLGLEPIRQALAMEGHPERAYPQLLVAGTNGKGETSAFLASILQAHGLRVGFFSSPHIVDFRERFRVDGRLLARADILRIGTHVLERYGDPAASRPALTFFETATLIAALAFAGAQVDVAVFEVGLGGRLDATNALDPSVSVVTAIGLDHTDYLGDTVEAIAAEKAGIFRAGKPAIVGRQAYQGAQQRLRELASDGSWFFDRDFGVDGAGRLYLNTSSGPLRIGEFIDAPQTRQWNAACAVAAAVRFLGDAFDLERTREGLSASRWPGRLDRRRICAPGESTAYDYFFDAAHNPDAARALFAHLRARQLRVGAIVCTSMRNKDVRATYAEMPDDVPVFAALLDFERAAGVEQLQAALTGKNFAASGPPGEMLSRARTAIDALREAGGQGAEEPVILVFGSIYLLGECFAHLGIEPDSLVSDIR